MTDTPENSNLPKQELQPDNIGFQTAFTGAQTATTAISNNNSLNSSALQSPLPTPRQVVSQEDRNLMNSNKNSKLNPESMPFCPQMLPPQLAQQQALYQQQLIQVCEL